MNFLRPLCAVAALCAVSLSAFAQGAYPTRPVTLVVGMIDDYQSYTRIYEQNQELKRELQQMKAWKEAAVQLEQQCSGLDRARRVTEVLGGEFLEAEFALRRALPQEIGVDVRVQAARCGQQRVRGRRIEAQQHVRRLDLHALAAGQFDLQAGARLGHDRTGLEVAVVVEQEVLHLAIDYRGAVPASRGVRRRALAGRRPERARA